MTCKSVLRRVTFPPPGQQGGQGTLLYDCLCCHIDVGRIGSGLIRVLHHGDVWSSRLSSSAGTHLCVHLCGSLAKCFPCIRCLCCFPFPPRWIYITAQVVCIIPEIPFMTSWRITCQSGFVYSPSLIVEYERQQIKEGAKFTRQQITHISQHTESYCSTATFCYK